MDMVFFFSNFITKCTNRNNYAIEHTQSCDSNKNLRRVRVMEESHFLIRNT